MADLAIISYIKFYIYTAKSLTQPSIKSVISLKGEIKYLYTIEQYATVKINQLDNFDKKRNKYKN